MAEEMNNGMLDECSAGGGAFVKYETSRVCYSKKKPTWNKVFWFAGNFVDF